MKQKKHIFRFDNWNYALWSKEYDKIIQWCGSYEISIKYVGKNKNGRCRWLEIEVDEFFANFILANMNNIWTLVKEK